MLYQDFLPNYYSNIIKGQQQSTIIDNLYFYVADGITQDAVANTNPKTIEDEQIVLNQIIYGGRVTPSNLLGMIAKIEWTPGKVFAKFNDRDPSLSDKEFYCINSLGFVYKCIDNNNGSPSTQEPVSAIPGIFQLSDGYIWCYMYKLTESQLLDYTVGNFIPLIEDPSAINAAVRGTISTIEVETPGSFTMLTSGEVQQVLSNNTVRIEDSAHSSSGSYNQMGLFVTHGPGQGEYYQISNYTANASGRYVTLDQPLVSAGLGSGYDIAPFIRISGNGENGSARAVMIGNQIGGVQILDRGSNYTIADATLEGNTAFFASPSNLQVNLSPPKGHGAEPYSELYVNYNLINIDLDNYIISNNLPIDEISFCKIGLIRGILKEEEDVLFSESSFNNTFAADIPTISGSFSVGDIIKRPNDNLTARVIHVDSNKVIGIYRSPNQRFTLGDTVVNVNGSAEGNIIDITQPQIRMLVADIVSITNIDTTTRDENSREVLQLLIKVK